MCTLPFLSVLGIMMRPVTVETMISNLGRVTPDTETQTRVLLRVSVFDGTLSGHALRSLHTATGGNGLGYLNPLPLILQDQLGPLWGASSHRISHVTAMALAPAAVRTGFVVDVPGPPVDAAAASAVHVRPYQESEATVFIGAAHLEGSTWVSIPERALLECLKREDDVPFGEAAAMEVLHTGWGVFPERVVGLAEQLGWVEPLRRLASIAMCMDDCRDVFPSMPEGFLADSQRELLDIPAAPRDSEWIALKPYGEPFTDGNGEFLDGKHREHQQ